MPTDPETTSWITAIVGALGLGGSGGLVRMIHKQTQKQVEFDQRHRATEARLARHSDAIKVQRRHRRDQGRHQGSRE